MGKGNKIPDRWRDYTSLGTCIPGTKIVAFKVPLSLRLCQKKLPKPEWFTPEMLLEQEPKLKTIIDLTNTHRYYNGQLEFGEKGVVHVKIMVEGKGTIPTTNQIERFLGAVDEHMEKHTDNDALIGVHCTHGLNRTGYFVCRWMIERLKMRPDEAIQRFNFARGHDIERLTLLRSLQTFANPIFDVYPLPDARMTHRRAEYISPLDDCQYDEPRTNRYGNFRNRVGPERNHWQHRERNDRNRQGHYRMSRADLDKNWRQRHPPSDFTRDAGRPDGSRSRLSAYRPY